MKVKICGITRLQDAELAVKLNAWALGFNFAEQSPRKISSHEARKISEKIPSHVEKVGVFVNNSKNEILEIVNEVKLNLVQLHGDEDEAFCETLNTPFIKVFRPTTHRDLEAIEGFLKIPTLKFLMIDGASKGAYGGTGKKADPQLALKMKKFNQPLILAGGLTPENVVEISKSTRPFALDVASGVESAPGIKDEMLLKAFFKKVEESGT